MGLPEIVITFKKAAETLVARSSRGVVALIVDDELAAQPITKVTRGQDISSLFQATNIGYINMAFEYGAASVLAVRLQDTLSDTLALMEEQIFNWLAYPGAQTEDTAAIVTWVKTARENGRTYKAVVYDAQAPNNAGIVNFTASSVTVGTAVYTGAQYTAAIAGILAGVPLTQSATYFVLDNVVSADISATPDADIDAGKLIVVFDGEKYKLGRAVTSLTTPAADESPEFKKIKHVEGADMIAYDIKKLFDDQYVGKIPNSYDNKQVLVAAIGDYLNSITGSVLDAGFENTVALDAIAIRAYLEAQGIDTSDLGDEAVVSEPTDSAVFLGMQIKFLDAMEDLALSIVIN